MKRIFCIITAALFAASAYSQSLRVSFNGSRDFQLVVDGTTYNSSNYMNNDVVINNLTGNHNIAVYRANKNGKNKRVYSSSVNLSPNQEVHLTINNGSIEREESSSNAAYGYRTPMSQSSFNTFYQKIDNQWGQSGKMSEARQAFSVADNYFSVDQVRRIIGLLNSESDRLELAKLAYDNITDPNNFSQIYGLLSSQASRNELDNYVRSYSYNDPYNSRVAMNSSTFNQLYNNVRNQWSTSAKISAATNAFDANTNYFTVAQVKQLISLISGESDRLQLSKAAIDNIVDPENYSQLFDLFYYQSSKDDLDSYIKNGGQASGNYSYHSAMTDEAFNKVYDDIRRQWWPGSKMSDLVETFNTPTNYFTTQQTKTLIALVSNESNRVELAKLSFDNIVDQQNFRQIYDLLSSQSSKDEVDEYIRVKYNYQY